MGKDSVSDLLFILRSKGVRVRLRGDQLCCRIEKGMLTSQERGELQARRAEIVEFLAKAPPRELSDVPLTPRLPSDRPPLTPSQSWWWRKFNVTDRGRRGVIATRLFGRLNVEVLGEAFRELVFRHEALRTTIVTLNDISRQRIDERGGEVLKTIELVGLSTTEREVAAKAFVDHLAIESIDVAVEPMFTGRLLRLGQHDHVLVIAIHDLISDITARGILWRDIWTIYVNSLRGLPNCLPPIPIQLADLACWYERSHEIWREKHGYYWKNRLLGATRVRLFAKNEVAEVTLKRTEQFWFRFEIGLTRELRAVALRQRTSLGMVILAVWVGLLMRWCDRSDIVVSFNTTGRLHPEVENIVGRLMCPLFLRIELQKGDTLSDLLTHVIEEYDMAFEHHDFGRISAAMPEQEFVGNPNLNWVPCNLDRDSAQLFNEANRESLVDCIRFQPFSYDSTLPDDIVGKCEPLFGVGEGDDNIEGLIMYQTDLVDLSTLERFARNFRFFAECLATDTNTRVAAISCVQ